MPIEVAPIEGIQLPLLPVSHTYIHIFIDTFLGKKYTAPHRRPHSPLRLGGGPVATGGGTLTPGGVLSHTPACTLQVQEDAGVVERAVSVLAAAGPGYRASSSASHSVGHAILWGGPG